MRVRGWRLPVHPREPNTAYACLLRHLLAKNRREREAREEVVNIKLHLAASLIAISIALPAFGQETPQTEQADRGRDVVVVTANKREETVQDIAVAVTAITAENKQELGIITVTDLTNVTPGLSYTPGNERVTLRGIGRLTNSFGADPGVANYNDGIYTAFAVFAGKDPLMIDRVEVLRGPQGTLYGRNAIGGAINTISKRPSDTFQVDAVVGGGSFGYQKFGVAVTGPINDSLRYRATGFREKREGIDPNYGSSSKEGWGIDDTYLELQLEGDFGDRFNWWLKVADYEFNKAGPPGGRTASFSTAPFVTKVPSENFFLTGSLTPNPAFAFTGDPSVTGFTQTGNRRDNPFATNREHAYNENIPAVAHLPKYDEAILEATYSMDTFDIKYTGGYTFYDYLLDGDADGTPVTSVTYNAVTDIAPFEGCEAVPIGAPTSVAGPCAIGSASKTLHPNVRNLYRESRSFFSNEINLISTTTGPLQWLFGAYQYQENSDQPGQIQTLDDEPLADFYVDPTLGVVANPNRYLQYFRNTSLFNAYGVYGQIDYDINQQLKVTGGLRWSKDVKESKEEGFLACYVICGFDYLNFTQIAFGGVPNTTFDDRGFAVRRLNGSWEAVTGTAGLEYRPYDDTMLFAKYSRGYKAGGFNNLGFGAEPYTAPEFVDALEGGWKQTWADWGLTTNAAVFAYKYSDAQAPLTVVTVDPTTQAQTEFSRFVNLPEVQTTGFELESNWNPIDPLNIGFTYAYLNAEVTKSDEYADASRGPGDPLRVRSVKGNTLSQTPKEKVALNASYRFDMADGSYFLPTASYSWRDAFYDTFFNNPKERAPSYSNLDARLNWYSPDKKLSVTAWIRNLTDEDQNTSVSADTFRPSDGVGYQTYSYSMPRMLGLDVIFHFE
jgi:iron complex outermembrane receptor protein